MWGLVRNDGGQAEFLEVQENLPQEQLAMLLEIETLFDCKKSSENT